MNEKTRMLAVMLFLMLANLALGENCGDPLDNAPGEASIPSGGEILGGTRDTEGLPEGKARGSRIRVAGPFQNAVRTAYRTSARFRAIYDRLQTDPRLELVIGRQANRLERCYFDKTLVRITYDDDGGIKHMQAWVQLLPGNVRKQTQRIGHELAHLVEILEVLMAPSTLAQYFPEQAYPVKGWINHYETRYAIEAELEIAEQGKDRGDDLSPDRLERLDVALFKDMALTQTETRRKQRYYRKLREKNRKRGERFQRGESVRYTSAQ